MSEPEDVVVREYVSMIQSMDPDLAPNDKQLLLDFLRLITFSGDFDLTVEDVMNLFGRHGYKKREDNLLKKLLGSQEGTDYKTVQEVRGKRGGRAKNNVFLSRDCFKQLCVSFPRNPVSKRLVKYFILVEDRYRELMMDKIKNRLAVESPYVTKQKQVESYMKDMRKKFPLHPCVYIVEFFDEKMQSLGKRKFGVSKGFPLRLGELVHIYPYYLKVISIHSTDNDMFGVERCMKNAIPQNEKSSLDEEVVTSSAEKLEALYADCEADMTKERKKYAHWGE